MTFTPLRRKCFSVQSFLWLTLSFLTPAFVCSSLVSFLSADLSTLQTIWFSLAFILRTPHLFSLVRLVPASAEVTKTQHTRGEWDLSIHTVQQREGTSGGCIRICTLNLCDPWSCRLSQIWIKPQTWSPFREAVGGGNELALIHVWKTGLWQDRKGGSLLVRCWWMNGN